MNWVHKLRLRAFALLVAGTLAAIGIASMAALPVWPVLGVAVAVVTLVVNRAASRLDSPTCLSCGASLAAQSRGEHGIICPGCGSISDTLV
ncbi:MAG: hypothetical protein IT437_10645 [Phycisphaerales bacterium]|nr:hypothetical protein [Phycisphaerales bacterium]